MFFESIESTYLSGLMKKGLFLLFFGFFAGFVGTAQPSLSPKFDQTDYRKLEGDRLLSLSVRSILAFEKDYPQAVIRYSHPASGGLVAVVPSADWNRVLADPNIRFIDIPTQPKAEAVLEHPNFHYNRIRSAQNKWPAFTGSTISISVKEQSFNPLDIDLIGRSFITDLSPTATSQHATEMATIIAGAGNFQEWARGVVPEATLTSSDFSNLLPDDERVFIENGIQIQNHSYGVNIENYYGVEAVAYDQSVFDHPTHVHVFSSGNFGSVRPTSGTYADLPYATLSGTFKQAKNVLLVNAVDSTYEVNIRNSIGPAYDGRLKPELTAYGAGGTSEATALVSGAAGMIMEYYRHHFSKDPSASLVKAILIATADDIGRLGPDFETGYGSMNLAAAIQTLEEGHHLQLELSPNSTNTFDITVPSDVAEMQLVMVWTDPPAAVNAEEALVHDLDMELSFGADKWYPWVLSSFPHRDSLEKAPTRRPDHLNTAEFISISQPSSGNYSLSISVPNLTTDQQEVSICWRFKMANSFSWVNPVGKASFQAGESVDLLWDQKIGGVGVPELRIGSGDWLPIQSSMSLDGPLTWDVPDTSAYAQLRMRFGEQSFESDTFTIFRNLEPSVSYNCDLELGLEWNELPEASLYRVYRMGETAMTMIAETTDTSLSVAKGAVSPYFSVAPLLDGREGSRSTALDYTFSGVFCFINFFSAERNLDGEVVVKLRLSTIEHLIEVEITKTRTDGKETLAAFSPTTTEIDLIDPNPEPGRTSYLATLHLKNGTLLNSDSSELYLEDAGKALLFPNPATTYTLNVLSDGTGQILKLYDNQGKFLLQKELLYTYDEVIIYDLEPGNYFYQLTENGQVIDSGRFVKY